MKKAVNRPRSPAGPGKSNRRKYIVIQEEALGDRLDGLAEAVDCSKAEALGILTLVWLWGANGNTGRDGKLLDADLSDVQNVFSMSISSKLDPAAVSAALVDTGWVYENDGALYVRPGWSQSYGKGR